MSKAKTLFERELEKPGFREKYFRERTEFQLELQILRALEERNYTYEEFAEKIGSTKGNISRDLKSRGLGKASIERIQKMAEALDLEFVPLLLPKDKKKRRQRVQEVLKFEREEEKVKRKSRAG
jgi:transcriptional regulator with XRE-family HTH domain